MYNLGPDEKTSTVMFYSNNAFVRGDVVTKENVRVSIWLRTQGVPNYIHLLKAQILLIGGTPPKSIAYNELFFPTTQIIAFHLAPPPADPLDYDANEANRTMVDVNLVLGTFVVKGKLRISTLSDFSTSIELGRSMWLSIYDADITNPFLAQMPPIHVPMMLVRPEQVSFGL
jgi:hypothetical protein